VDDAEVCEPGVDGPGVDGTGLAGTGLALNPAVGLEDDEAVVPGDPVGLAGDCPQPADQASSSAVTAAADSRAPVDALCMLLRRCVRWR
jgi:hypothetical protein